MGYLKMKRNDTLKIVEDHGDYCIVGGMDPLSGGYHTKKIHAKARDVEYYWQADVAVQNAFPNMEPSEREFIMTGINDWIFEE